MASEVFHIEYDKLQQVGKIFQDQATAIEDMAKSIQQAKSRLDQTWSGDAYNKFNEEMNSAVLPKLTKLSTNLQSASQLISKLAEGNKGFEGQAKSVFQPPVTITFTI